MPQVRDERKTQHQRSFKLSPRHVVRNFWLLRLMAEWMTPVTCGAKSKRFVAAAFTPGAFESFVCWRVWSVVNARKLRLTSDVYGSGNA